MGAKKKPEKTELDLDLLPELVGYQLRLAQIAIFRDFSATLGGLDMTPGLFGVLVIIDANAGLTQNALAKATHLDRSTVVTVIDKLEHRGLVERHAAIPDRRAYALVLTAAGEKLLRKLKTLVREHESRLCKNLTSEERAQLVRLLEKIFPELR
ncbi:MAG TPA: MarR family transcriptional regulator [Burkholderiaceae bacterium]|nr:MarR family transcriptional regulator [Burkholderiaceae bacterium]